MELNTLMVSPKGFGWLTGDYLFFWSSNVERTEFPTLLLGSSEILAENMTSSNSIYPKQQAIKFVPLQRGTTALYEFDKPA